MNPFKEITILILIIIIIILQANFNPEVFFKLPRISTLIRMLLPVLFPHLWRGKSRGKHLPHLILTPSVGQNLSKPSPVQHQRIKPQAMHKQFQVMQTSSRKGLGNRDPHFLQKTHGKFWPRTCDVAHEPKPTMAAGIPARGGWAQNLCLLIFNSPDYPGALRSPNVCLTGSVCWFEMNPCHGNVQPGCLGGFCWMGSRGWEEAELSCSRHAPRSANKRIQSFHLLLSHFQWMQTLFSSSLPFNFKLV